MKIVVDTNIVFSALLNSEGSIGDLIFNSHDIFEFYSCSYMRHEIQNHWDKLKRISKLSDAELHDLQLMVFGKINFINEELIPTKTWLKAEELTTGIDLDDTDFVTLAKYLKANLWTGDKVLHNGLLKKGFKKGLSTPELLKLRGKLSK